MTVTASAVHRIQWRLNPRWAAEVAAVCRAQGRRAVVPGPTVGGGGVVRRRAGGGRCTVNAVMALVSRHCWVEWPHLLPAPVRGEHNRTTPICMRRMYVYNGSITTAVCHETSFRIQMGPVCMADVLTPPLMYNKHGSGSGRDVTCT